MLLPILRVLSGSNGTFFRGLTPVNVWYPINPDIQSPEMGYSIYIYDSLATGVHFPCDSSNVLVDEQAHLNTLEKENPCIVYPNPGTNQLTIKTESKHLIEKIQVIDITGKIMSEKAQIGKGESSISTKHLQTGSYIIIISLENGEVLTKKWIKL